MACGSCGQRYRNAAKQRAMKKNQKQGVVQAPQPLAGNIVTPPAQPDIISAGQVVTKELTNTDNKAQKVTIVDAAVQPS